MSDNYAKELEDYCRSHCLPAPIYSFNKLSITNDIVATITIGNVIDGKNLNKFAATELEAKNNTARAVLEHLQKKEVDRLASNTEKVVIKTEAVTTNDSSMHSSEHIHDEVSQIKNPVGYLNEWVDKNVGTKKPNYKEKGQFGESHSPLFVIECILEYKSQELIVEGKGCPKKVAKERAARAMIRRIRQIESESIPSAAIPLKSDLNNYFSKKFGQNREIDECFVENGINIKQQLEKLAALLGCRLLFDPSGDNSQVVLKVVVNGLDYPLVTTYAINESLASKKAVHMLKICYQNQ